MQTDQIPNDISSVVQEARGDKEWLAIMEEEATPLANLWPDEWALYKSYFIDFWPRLGFFVFRDYRSGWYQQKKSDKPLFCFDGFIEQHLDHRRWATHLQVHKKKNRNESEFCIIGLNASKLTRFACFDVDNKGTGAKKDSIVGWYRSPDLEVRREPAWLPVMMPQLKQFQTAKVIYDAGLADIWCISSETLGLHAWKKHPGLTPTICMVMHYQEELTKLGLIEGKSGDLEVHPNSARCLRRPFGPHYRIIATSGVLNGWRDQLRHFDKPTTPPTFEAIIQALEGAYLEQWRAWQRWGDARKKERPLDIAILQARLDGIKAQLFMPSTGASAFLPPVQPPRPAAQRCSAPGRKRIDIKRICQDHAYIDNLQRWARKGIPEPGALFDVVSQLAAWLLWVECFSGNPDKVVATLVQFMERGHNNNCSRWPDNQDEVIDQIGRIVELKLSEGDNEVWASIRAKREAGAYRRLIFLAPILRGEDEADPPAIKQSHTSTPVLLICDTLRLQRMLDGIRQLADLANMRKRRGEYPVVRFAERLVHELYAHGGTRRLGQKWFHAAGFKNIKDRERYKELLAKANILIVGEYALGRRSRQYSLTQEVRDFLDGHRDDLGEALRNMSWEEANEILGP